MKKAWPHLWVHFRVAGYAWCWCMPCSPEVARERAQEACRQVYTDGIPDRGPRELYGPLGPWEVLPGEVVTFAVSSSVVAPWKRRDPEQLALVFA